MGKNNAGALTSIELCAGAGGQALGLEQAGFGHLALVEIDKNACQTLRLNRPQWNVLEMDLAEFDGRKFKGVQLVAAGVPCPPFSIAGKQLGSNDDRDLFPEAIRIVEESRPRAVLFENVKGLLSSKFDSYRNRIEKKIGDLGYIGDWRLLNAADFGVPQTRRRAIFVGFQEDFQRFSWPSPKNSVTKSVGEALYIHMKKRGWRGAESWSAMADSVAPTIVGGSKRHGGPDLGPTRAREIWRSLGVNGKGIERDPPDRDFEGMPKLTVEMAAVLQGFPDSWKFSGPKTHAYRQVGNAFPPAVAREVGTSIAKALTSSGGKTPELVLAKA